MNHQKPPLSEVEAISESHDVSRFDCGDHESLNDWLKRFALTSQRNESARTYVVHRNSLVVGYYSISAGSVSVEEAAVRISKGLRRHAIPVILLARLAVDKHEKGAGLGKTLLKDALARIAQAADTVGLVQFWSTRLTSKHERSTSILISRHHPATNCT
jgi:hypothetical protein